MYNLVTDHRWIELLSKEWFCDACKTHHDGLNDLAFDRPMQVDFDLPILGNEEFDFSKSDILTEDYCIFDGQHFYVRSVLPLELNGIMNTEFCFGVWSSLSSENFKIYYNFMEGHSDEKQESAFSFLSNPAPSYDWSDDNHFKSTLVFLDRGERPAVFMNESGHGLYVDQQEGINFDRMLEILEACGCQSNYLGNLPHDYEISDE